MKYNESIAVMTAFIFLTCHAYRALEKRGTLINMATRGNKRELVIRKSTTANSEKPPGEEIFDIVSLNNLEVSGFSELCNLSNKIANLNNLLQLVLKGNSLTSLPSEIGALESLRHLDLSFNTLSSVPVELYKLNALQTLILSNNKLIKASFPDLEQSSKEHCLTHLQYIDVSQNQLEELPPFLFNCSQLAELLASNNSLNQLSVEIGQVTQLKTLDLSTNSISELPQELSNCSKLRSLLLTGNPIADRRLLKLIDQHGATKPRAVLDYVRSHGSSTQTTAVKAESKSKKKGKKSAASKKVDSDKDEIHESDDDVIFGAKYCVRVTKPTEVLEIKATQSARAVRQYIVCCVIKNMDLASPGNFKKFINIQVSGKINSVCK